VANCKEAFIAYFTRMAAECPGKRVEFKRALVEGNLVELYCRRVWPGLPGYAEIDIFRPNNKGKIIEPWDVL
jgi:predicted SnoaL-like aldol condensation-catalyzing enzyme